MEEITVKGWRLGASVIDSDILRVEIDAQDGTDIIETGYAGQGGKDGDQYVFRFTTQQIEEQHSGPKRRPSDTDEADIDAEEDETLYLRGWEVTALVDEEGLLHLQIEKGLEADIFETDPIESNQPLGPRVVLRLAAEDLEEDDEDTDEDNDDVDDLDDDEDVDVDDMDADDEDDALEEEYEDEFEEEADQYSRYGRGYRDSDYY